MPYNHTVWLPQTAPGWATPTLWVCIAVAVVGGAAFLYALAHPGWRWWGRTAVGAATAAAIAGAVTAGVYTPPGYPATAAAALQAQMVEAYGDVLNAGKAPHNAAGTATYNALTQGKVATLPRGAGVPACTVWPVPADSQGRGTPRTAARTTTTSAPVLLVCSGAPMQPAGAPTLEGTSTSTRPAPTTSKAPTSTRQARQGKATTTPPSVARAGR